MLSSIAIATVLSCSDSAGPGRSEPGIARSSPSPGDQRVATSASVTVFFTNRVDSPSVGPSTFRLMNAATGASVAGSVLYSGGENSATFDPATPLSTNTKYRATLTTGIRASNGVALAVEWNLDFTTIVQAEGSLRARHNTTCAIAETGDVYCWGGNDYGQLGIGSLGGPQVTPALVSGGHKFSALSLGETHTCGIAMTGTFCWGSNSRGEGGNGSYGLPRATPTRVVGGDAFRIIDANGLIDLETTGFGVCIDVDCRAHACALDLDGKASCWGSSVSSPAPRPVAATLRFTAFSTSVGSWCGIATDALTYCSDGPIGAAFDSPGFESISRGRSHSCGIVRSGDAYCWGANSNNQLGAPTSTSCFLRLFGSYPCSPVPVLVAGGHRFAQISASNGGHTCAFSAAMDIYCWGLDNAGQIGIGNFAPSGTPVRILSNQKFASVSAGADYTCAVTVNGEGYCWGGNGSGQLGDGTQAGSSIPVLVRMPAGVRFR